MFNFSQDERQKIYTVYLAIFNLPFNVQRKSNLLTSLMGGTDLSWRVIGITKAALEELSLSKYKYAKGKICRAHLVDRLVTARAVFEIQQPLTEDKFFTEIWKNDKTLIAVRSENKKGATFSEIFPINYKHGLFKCNSLVGFKHGKCEADFLKTLHEKTKR